MKGSFCLLLGTGLALAFARPLSSQSPGLHYSVSWIGNSFSGKTAWVLQDVSGICVLPDGTLFTNTFWDESGGNVQEYRDGRLIGVAGHTHGWGYEGGDAVAASSHYLFIVENADNEGGGLVGSSWPPKGFTWSGISRRPLNNISSGAPFPGGRGKEGDVLQGAFLPVVQVPEGQEGATRGICCTEHRLFVSSPFDNTVKVYDPESMGLLQTWPVPRPDRICLDQKSHVWVLQRGEAGGRWSALCFTQEGVPLPPAIQFTAGMVPADITVDQDNRLLVADNGPDQQVKIYRIDTRDPAVVGTFGIRGGILAHPAGVFGPRRFNQPRAIGADAAGNRYVASSGSVAGGSTVLECYGSDGRLRWRRFGLTFVDLPDALPPALADVYTKEEHFKLAEFRPPGEDWTYRGYTVNRFRYPDDPRLHTGPTNAWVRILHEHRFLFVTGMTADYLSVYRFQPATDGEIAIPCALFAKRHAIGMGSYPPHQPASGEWIWLDRNGNGAIDPGEYVTNGVGESQGIMVPDDWGTIWQANEKGIRALPLVGVDGHGSPRWDYAHARSYPNPGDLDSIRLLKYLPDRDVMLLAGNRGADHNQHWKPMGPVLCVYDGWSTEHPTLRSERVLPYEKGSNGHESIEPISFDVAGDYVFVAYTRGLKAESLRNAFVRVLRLADLSFVGNLSAESVLGDTGLLDLVESVDARRRPDGEYLVFLEDDYRSKIIVFRWRPG